VSGFEPDPTSIVSLSLLVWASPRVSAFLRQAVFEVTGVVMTYQTCATHQFHQHKFFLNELL